jgi:outer membrane immunogenic protein
MTIRTLLSVSAFAVLSLGAMPALAQTSNVYVGGGYTHFEGDDAAVGGLTGRLGVGFGQHFAVEGEVSLGVVDDNIGAVNVELDNAFGLFGVAKAPISPQFDVFGRVGWAQAEVSGSLGGVSASADDNGLAYGVGANFWLTGKDGIRGDYTRYDFDGDGELDTFAISYVRKF